LADTLFRRPEPSESDLLREAWLRETDRLKAQVTCRHQAAGNSVKDESLLLLLGDLAGLLRSLLHCALRLLCLLSFLGHIALLMLVRWLIRCVHSGIEMHSSRNTPTHRKKQLPA